MNRIGEDSALFSRARNASYASWGLIGLTGALLVTELADGLGLHDPLTMSEAMATIYVGLGVGYGVVFLASVVFVAMWIHRAHANLHEAGMGGLEFTPGWAVGWYFIPFANLIKPFQAMRELWNASTGLGDRFSAPAPDQVKFWWGTWIVGNILSNISTRMVLTQDTGTMQTGSLIGAVSSALTIFCAWQLIKLIREISQAQLNRMQVAEVFD